MPSLRIDQTTAKQIESGAGAIIAGKVKCVRDTVNISYCTVLDIGQCNILKCADYKHRFKSRDTIFFLRTNLKFCNYNHRTKDEEIPDDCWTQGNIMCILPKLHCSYQGAKLVHKAKILKSYPVKFEDLTEEIAEKCGYTAHWHKAKKREYVALECLQFNLRKKYNAKSGDIFQVVEFEKAKQ